MAHAVNRWAWTWVLYSRARKDAEFDAKEGNQVWMQGRVPLEGG